MCCMPGVGVSRTTIICSQIQYKTNPERCSVGANAAVRHMLPQGTESTLQNLKLVI